MDTEEQARQLLTRAFREALLAPPDKISRANEQQRAFRVGLCFVCVAPFCTMIGLVPWPFGNLLGPYVWLGFSLVLLLLGGWKIDQASRSSRRKDHPPPTMPDARPAATPPLRKPLHRIK